MRDIPIGSRYGSELRNVICVSITRVRSTRCSDFSSSSSSSLSRYLPPLAARLRRDPPTLLSAPLPPSPGSSSSTAASTTAASISAFGYSRIFSRSSTESRAIRKRATDFHAFLKSPRRRSTEPANDGFPMRGDFLARNKGPEKGRKKGGGKVCERVDASFIESWGGRWENSARRSRKGGAEQGTSGVTVLALYGGWILIEAQRIKLLKIRLSLLVLFLVLLHLPRRPPFPSSISAFRLATTANHFLFASFLSRGFLLIPANQTFYTRRTSRFRGLSNQL